MEMIEDVVKLANSLKVGLLLIDLPELLKHDKQLLILIESQLRRILRFLKLWSKMPPAKDREEDISNNRLSIKT